ncbi:hypothetical protein [Rhodoplanes roseus]|uniref:Uncharacterized protein n=1 Tax=Rhodoplanes roseus TaxID=29409 RepID=A0A327L5A6_9BRAD|nr:hypothetical protein [Rhodoplanes roseus]RAI42808.1 hypothetical protein CH341_17595 [Rhodoplanes roseus]
MSTLPTLPRSCERLLVLMTRSPLRRHETGWHDEAGAQVTIGDAGVEALIAAGMAGRYGGAGRPGRPYACITIYGAAVAHLIESRVAADTAALFGRWIAAGTAAATPCARRQP